MSDDSNKKPTDYEKAPQVPESVRPLYEAVLAVQAGTLTVTEAARQLGLSRNRFQTRMHRALRGLITEMEDKPQGRPPKPQREAELEAKLQRLEKENAQLKSRVDTVQRLMGLASELAQGKIKLRGRSRRTEAATGPEESGNDGEEPDGAARSTLRKVQSMRQLGIELGFAAALAASSASTVRRYARRARLGQPLVQQRGPRPGCPLSEHLAAGSAVVRQMRGLIGAEALAHCVPGLSRRKAAAVKRQTLTLMERERIDACTRISVTVPGVVRGFDAMYVNTTAGLRYLLAAADASVPYRTLISPVMTYDSTSVAGALEQDILMNGAPLVYRMDRASCHRTPEVQEVLDRHDVLVLHGPPHHPGYYGQLERQNREHRAWLNACGALPPEQLEAEATRMQYAWNCTLPRRSLSWRTASEVWCQREELNVDRRALREEVTDRAARLQRQLDVRGAHADLVERIALEATLVKHGWLVMRSGAGC